MTEPIDETLRGAMGRPLASDLLAVARARNPGLEIKVEERDREVAAERDRPVKILALVVCTDRGEMVFFRDPRERWSSVYRRAGLL